MPKAKLSADQRRALELLAGCSDGITETLLSAYRINHTTIAELIVVGLASATRERVFPGRKPIDVRRIRITDAGRRAIDAMMPAISLLSPHAS